jgi:hypothetical protein
MNAYLETRNIEFWFVISWRMAHVESKRRWEDNIQMDFIE